MEIWFHLGFPSPGYGLLYVSCCYCNMIFGQWVARFPHLKLIYSFVWQNCCFQSISTDTEIKASRGLDAQGSRSSFAGRHSPFSRESGGSLFLCARLRIRFYRPRLQFSKRFNRQDRDPLWMLFLFYSQDLVKEMDKQVKNGILTDKA